MITKNIKSKNLLISFVLILFTLSGIASASSIYLYDSKDYPYDIYDGCYMDNGEGDAYDGMYYLWINGVQYAGTRSATEDSGREAVCDVRSLSGLNVVRKVFVPTTENWARYLEVLSNPTGSPLTVNVRVGGNLGSDSSTRIIQTSNGDATLDNTDRWVVTDDNCNGCGDPSLAHVFDGEVAQKKIDTLWLSGSDDLYYEWQNVIVQPGSTVIIMHFAVQHTNNANAIAEANAIKAPKPEMTISGMDESETNAVVNWALAEFTFKKLAPPEALAGQSILYNITYFNNFDYNLTNFTIYDFLPSDITFIASSCGGSFSDGTLIANIGNVSGNSGGYCEINANVNANVSQGRVIINTANISYVNSIGEEVNVTQTNQTLVPNPELDFKSTSTCTVSVEDVVNYTISYQNTGISTARNTSIKNYLPSGIEYVSDNGGGSYSSGVVTFVLGDVLSGESKNLTITAKATNSAEVMSLNNVSLYYENDTGIPFEWYSEASTTIGNFDIVVDKAGSTSYSTIQEGINNASSGNSIFVCPGTYYETVDVDRSVNLLGAGAEVSKVDADGSYDYVFEINADNVNISNFNITGSRYDGVRINSNFVNIFDNTITNNQGNGIYLYYSSDNNLINNTVSSNSEGIYLYNSGNNLLSDINAIENNDAGIYTYYSSNNIFTNINARNNQYGMFIYYQSNGNIISEINASNNIYYGLYSYYSSNNIFTNINASNSQYGMYIYYQSNGNNISEIDASNNIYYGLYSYYSQNNNFTGIIADDNDYGFYFSSSNNNNITDNSIGMNNYGITLSDSNNNYINNNFVVGNPNLDFNVYSSVNSGENNTCDKPDGWNDNGVVGCSHLSKDISTYPDFEVTGISWSPTNFNISENVEFNVTVKNLGPGNFSGELYLGLYLDGEPISTPSEITNLNTDQEQNYIISWYCNKGGSNRTLTARADYNNYWAEFNETNNELSVVLPYSSGPDLVVTDITWSPTNFSSSDTVTFFANISNIGDSYTGDNYATIGLYIDGNYVNYAYYGYYSYVNLTPGMNITISSTWIAQGGNHSVTAKVDDPYCCGNYIFETNETNNDFSVNLPHTPGPDLVVSNITLSPANFKVGDTVTFFANITNIGESYTGNKNLYAGFYIDGTYIGYSNYGYINLTVGQYITVSRTWTAQAGNHSLTAKVDDPYCCGNNVQELNETNNDFSVNIYTPSPDLVVSNITWSPTNFKAGDTVTFFANITNTGDSFTGDNYENIGLYIDGNYVNSAYYGYYSYVNLTPGMTITISSTWTALGGSHSVTAKADDPYCCGNYIRELNETNNDLTVTLPFAPGPDLVITDITWSPYDYNPGDTVTFFANITNIGDSYTRDNYEYIGLYIDGNYVNYGYSYANLTPGMTITVSSTWAPAQGGNHSVTVKVDDPYCCGNNILETNETNNGYTVNLAGIDLPDLVITDLSWTPLNYSAGDPVVFNATFENIGAGTWNGPVRVDFYYKNTTYITSTSPSMSLPPGGVGYATVTWSPAQAGDFYFRAQADQSNYIQESNESNNNFYIRNNNVAMPDLIVDKINLKVEHKLIPRADQNDNIFWKYNITTPVSDWKNLSYDDSNWSTGKAPIGNTGSYRTNLNLAGGSGYFRKVFNLTSTDNITLYIASQAGVDVWVNGMQVLAKSSENIGYSYWNYQVDISPYVQSGQNILAIYLKGYSYCYWYSCYYYNYLDTEITNYAIGSPESASISSGDTVTVNATIKNAGLGNMSSWSFYNYLYVDGSSYTSVYKTMSLPANGTDYATFSWPAKPGSHSIRVLADSNNYINEANEINNDLTAYLQPIASPDLIVEDIFWSPQNYSAGQTVTLYATIKNMGPGYASGGFYTMFYVDGSYLNYYGTNYPGIIPPEGSINVTQTWTAQGGSHTVKAKADCYYYCYYSSIAEIDESNNERTESLIPIYYPDMVITGVTASRGGVTVNISDLNASDGEPVTFNATIKNIGLGNISATNLYVNYYIDGSYVAQRSIYQELPVNGTANISAVWTATPGTHTFMARADPNNYIQESSEINNEYSAALYTISYADLIVTDLTWTPSNYSDGDTVTFNAKLQNIGDGNTTRGFYTRFLIDGGYIGEIYLPDGLASDGLASVTQSWVITPGEHKIKALADYYGYVSESNESNNSLELNLTKVDQSDLIVSDLFWTPSNFSDGNTLTFSATIQNIGLGNTTRGFYTRFLIDGSDIGGPYLTGLASNSSMSVSQTWTVTPGEHKIKAYVDIWNYVSESNESNNTLELNLTKVDPPELTVSSLSWSPLNFSDGVSVTFNTTIQNIGIGNTTRGFYTRFLIDGIDIGGPYISGLLSGDSISVTQSWTATPGDHKIKAVADYWNHVSESNESNNTLELNLTKVEMADLKVTDISWTPSNFSDGQTVTFNAIIQNTGPGNTTRSFYTRFFIDGIDIGGPSRPGLASGSIMSVTQTWTATTGEHKIKAIADYWNSVSELNETNNSLELNLTKVDPADLTVTALSWTPLNISDGQIVTFNASVENIGSGNTTRGFHTRFLIDGVDIGGPYITGLASGYKTSVTQTWTATPGEHKIKAVADYWNSVSESNETNNSVELALQNVTQSDLTVSSLTWSPSNFSDGEVVTFNSIITNVGTGNTKRSFYTRFLIDGSNIGDRYIAGLDSGSSSGVTQTWTATPGEHNISVIVDIYGYVSESDETNNKLGFNLSKVDQADLVLSNITWAPPTFSDGQTVTFRASINNADNGNTTRGFYTRFLMDDIQIGEKYISGLNSGSTVDLIQVWPASPGNHTLKMVIDQYNHVSESNESNNIVSIILPEVAKSDLVVTALSWNPASFSDGQRVTLNATIQNIGPGNTSRQFYASFKIGGGCEGNLLISGLATGESKSVSLVWVASSGDHNLTAIADPDGFITETNRDNNNLSYDLPSVPWPDLIITGLDWSPKNPGDGDIVSFNVTVSNTGAGNTSRNTGVQLDIDDVYFQRTLLVGLEAGKSITLEVPKKWNAKFGVHSIKAIADSISSIKESDETNNNYTVYLDVTDSIPPVLSSITPANGSIKSLAPNVTVLLSDGTGSGVDLAGSSIGVKQGAVTVSGAKSIDGNKIVFTPNSPFDDGDYNVTISAFDISGNNRIIDASFVKDTTSPVINISGVTESAIYNTSVIPDVMVTDLHLLAKTIKMNGLTFIPGTTINTDGTYHILVEATDAAGNNARSILNFTVDAKPAAPTGLRMSRAATTADLLWNPNIEADIAGYNIYRDGLKQNSELIYDNEYRDTGLSPGISYLYNVTAVDASGQESDMAGLSPIRITLDGYGSLSEDGYYLTRGFADSVNFSIINEGTSSINAKSGSLEVLDIFGNVTYNVSEGPFTIASLATRSSGKVILTGSQTDRIVVKVQLADDTLMSRVFYVNVRNAPGKPVEMTAPTLIEGYRDLIELKFTNFGSASMGIDPLKVRLLLRDSNGSILSQGRGEGFITWIGPNSSRKIRAFINTPVAEGEISLLNLSINGTIPTLYGEMRNGTIFNISENVSSKYQTVKPIDIYHGSIIKGVTAQFDAVFNNQGTEDLTVNNGAVTINIKDLNGSIISSGNYFGPPVVAIHDGSQKFQISALIPNDAPDTLAVQAIISAGYFTIDSSAVPIIFNVTALMSSVKPDYNANAITNKAIYDRNEPVLISGIARYEENGSIVANAPVLLKISNKGFERKDLVNTNDAGEYNYTFQPLDNEAGKYIVSVTHPSVKDLERDAEFEILGLYIDPKNIILTMSKNSQRTIPVQVKNIGETELTGIQLTVIDDNPTDGVNAIAETGNFKLAPKESRNMNVNVGSELGASDTATFIIRALGDNGSSADSTLKVNLVPAEPIPRIEPGFIHTGANPGTSEVKTIKIQNTGYLTLKNVSLINPVNSWISIITDPAIGDIPPGGNKTFDIMINPGMDVALGIYDDAVKITSDNYADISFRVGVFVTSEKVGTLKFTVRNQLGDVLPNADVSIIDMETYSVAMKNRTDTNGIAIFFGIPTGRYSYKVDAMYHDEVVGNVYVDVGTSTTTVGVTAVYNFLEVEWTVTPTTIKDVYSITHNITYNTTVPVPYVKMDVVYDSVYMVPGSVYHGNVTLTNMNDIVSVSNGLPFARSSNELVSVEFLVDKIPELKPHESITVPFVVKLATHHSPTPKACDKYELEIGYNFENVHVCWLDDGTELTASVPRDTFRMSIKPSCIEAVRDIALCVADALTSCAGSTGITVVSGVASVAAGNAPGQAGACVQTVANCQLNKFKCSGWAVTDCIDNVAGCMGVPCSSCVSAANSLAKCLFQDNCCSEEEPPASPPPYTPPTTSYGWGGGGGGGWGGGGWGGGSPYTTASCAHSPATMCVKILLEIKQEMTLERQAFDANLKLKNVQPDYDMNNISVNITFTNASGGFSNNMFFTNLTELIGMMDVNSGTIDAGATATMHWLIIPTPGAGGNTSAGEKYTVKATINYTVKGVEFSAETWPDTITVEPMPRLTLDYVLPHRVLADNPQTEGIIEPVVPFMFGVRVNNSGYGPANNLAIDSAQPAIVSSTEKTNIEFRLLGTYVDGKEIKNTLKINFGNVQSKSCKAAGWIMMTTVSGYFSNYSATFKHADALGGEATSLMDSINTHVLIHEFINDQPGNDTMYDFIIDTDNNSIPDKIMDSGCNDEPIAVVTAAGSNTPTIDNPVLNVTSGSAQGWGYMSVNDPMNNVYPILKIVRSDGKVLSRYNYWMQENTIFFVDYNPSDKYSIVYKVPLLISNVAVNDISTESGKISWDSDRQSNSIVKYGTRSGVYTAQKKNVTVSGSHIVNLNELVQNTTYYYVVNSTHPSGNSNESAEFNFTTLKKEDTNLILSINAPKAKERSSNMTYNLYYVNMGGAVAKNVTIDDTLSEYVDFISASEGASFDPVTRNVTWNLDTVSGFPGGYGSVNVTVKLKSPSTGTIIQNSATITTSNIEIRYDDNTAQTETTVTGLNLPSGVNVEPNNGGLGIPSVYWGTPTNFILNHDAISVDITIQVEGKLPETYSMSGISPDWTYSTTFYPQHGHATITYTIHNGDGSSGSVPFDIYIDPAGYIYDVDTGARIQNATVWLQQPDGYGGWENVTTGLVTPIAIPDENPLTTGADGQYQWDVIGGIYRVHVEASQYYPANSSFVSVPPPVTDLHVGLKHFPDVTAPGTVTYLHNISFAPTYINWTWADPGDADLDHVEVYVDNTFKENSSKGKQYYNAIEFTNESEHTISTRTVDKSGNVNYTWQNHTARTSTSPDNTPPESVTDLHNITYEQTYINWTWADPADLDFARVEVYINSILKAIVEKGQQYFNATLLAPGTEYTISTRTVDTNGNINETWENRTARTAAISAPSDSTPPVITNIGVSGIGTDNANISWLTDEPSDSSVSYGDSPGSYTTTIATSDMVLSHSFSLIGLLPEMKYYYVVRSADANGNPAQSPEFNFTTLALPDSTNPIIDSVVVYPANTTASSKVEIKVVASDNKEVTEVSADGYAFTYSDGYWNGNITASSIPGTYDVLIKAKDAAGNYAQTTVKYTVVSKVGGIAITSTPKPLSIVRGLSGQLNIKLISTANIDDRVWVNITTTGIAATSAIDLTWFNRTSVLVEVPSKATVFVPFGVAVPSGAGTGYKTFKNNAKSLGFNATSVDTGMVNVKP